jgi:UDP-N-acetyl-D-mannosaminuronate dehydrogenase
LASLEELLAQSDIVLLLTDHQQFRDLPATSLRGKQVIDTRGVWKLEAEAAAYGSQGQATSRAWKRAA